jgi:4-hydroxy-2-oxoglutarate aldolase
MENELEGVFIALTTPFVGDRIAPEKLAANIEKYNRTAVAGYVVLGTTGESVYLTDDESLELVEATVKAAAPAKRVIVGTARESTRWTLEFTAAAAEFGIAAALVRPPSYFKSRMTREALKKHFLTLAEECRVPVIIYNIPQTTGISLDPALVVELAGHPNIIGIKESSGSLPVLAEVIREAPTGFRYFLGSGHVLFPGFGMGACGAILAVANAAPELAADIYKLFRAGRMDEAKEKQLALVPLNKAVTEKYGIAGLKYAQDLRGLYGGLPRPPLLPLSEEGKNEMSRLVAELGLFKPVGVA